MLPKYGSPRVKFSPNKQIEFLNNVFHKSNLNSVGLAKVVGVSDRTIRDWRREKFYIPLNTVNLLCNRYEIAPPKGINKMVNNWTKNKLAISKQGGIAYYQKYGLPGTRESRRRGGIAGIKKLRELGLVAPINIFKTPNKSKDLAEFVGIMLGDGSIGKSQTEITLNSVVEEKYAEFVSNLSNKLFGKLPKITKKKDCNALSIYSYGINLVKYLAKIGLKEGNKVRQQVSVPSWITSNKEFSKRCCRGLIDTDGCIAIHRYYVNRKRYFYKKLIFTNHSIPLANFVYETLFQNGLHPKMYSRLEKRRVWLYNSNEVQKYLNIIGQIIQNYLDLRRVGRTVRQHPAKM